MKILVSGGAGYIGTHTIVELVGAGHYVVVVDNLVNSNQDAIKRVEEICSQSIPFYKVDIRDRSAMEDVLLEHKVEVCIHFAGLKAVSESVIEPWKYYDNNINGTLVLLDVLRKHGCKNIIFSSSATVYGEPKKLPITEKHSRGICTNPYGWTKWMVEQILTDLYRSDPSWNIIILRYFNPIGAHRSGLLGEEPNGIPSNLLPYITQVATGNLEKLHIFGDDYDTHDGTGVRDYIHVVDLARGHVSSLKAIRPVGTLKVYNLGTGKGYSVFDIINAFEKVNNVKIPYQIDHRRPGDVAVCYSNCKKAEKELGWKAEFGLEDMVRDAWRWQKWRVNSVKTYDYGEHLQKAALNRPPKETKF